MRYFVKAGETDFDEGQDGARRLRRFTAGPCKARQKLLGTQACCAMKRRKRRAFVESARTLNREGVFTWAALAVAFLMILPARTQASADEANNTNFGFAGPETYPIDNFIAQLRVADLDGDGLNDLIIVNNARSKITFLTTRPARPTGPPRRAAPQSAS